MPTSAEEFASYLEQHRHAFEILSQQQQKELARLYMDVALTVKERAELIIEKKGLTYAQAKIRINSLLREALKLNKDLESVLNKSLIESAGLGTEFNKAVMQAYEDGLKKAGYIIPVFTGNKVVYGHDALTPYNDERDRITQRFFDDDTSEQERVEIIENFEVRYVYFGPWESSKGFDPENSHYLQEVYSNQRVKIFEVLI